jgi:hypothetical protein
MRVQQNAEAVPTEVQAEAVPNDKVEYLEFLGTDSQFGTEFYGETGTHSVTAKHLKEAADVDLGMKEAVWRKGRNGRFLVKTSDLTPEAVEHLATDPMFRVVSL